VETCARSPGADPRAAGRTQTCVLSHGSCPSECSSLAACMGNGQPPTTRLARITRQTLVATGCGGQDSFVGGGSDFFGKAADAIAASIPQAERQTIEGHTHEVDRRRSSGARTVIHGMTSLRITRGTEALRNRRCLKGRRLAWPPQPASRTA
jgi:hypothetical protein